MKRAIGISLWLAVATLGAYVGACSSSDTTNAMSDAGGNGRGEAGYIDPVYGENDAGVFLGGGGSGTASFDAGVVSAEAGSAVGLVVNEVDYDNVGTDNREFVEIYNGTGNTLDLSNVALVLVDGTSEYGRVDLSGSLSSGQYLVAADPSVTLAADAGARRVALPTSSNALRNSTAGVGLLDKAKGTLLDALSYAGSVTSTKVNGVSTPMNFVEGTATTAVDSNTTNGSLCRMPNGTDTNNANSDWKFCTTPTPGASN